jgi:hypothetical protein
MDTRLNSPTFQRMCWQWADTIAAEDRASHRSLLRLDRFAMHMFDRVIVDTLVGIYLLLYCKASMKSIRTGGAFIPLDEKRAISILAWSRQLGVEYIAQAIA